MSLSYLLLIAKYCFREFHEAGGKRQWNECNKGTAFDMDLEQL